MGVQAPSVVILAGPNGAGKTTSAPLLLKGSLGVDEYVNADVIAQGLSGFAPERAALEAAEVMLSRLSSLAKKRVSFAFETTLASRSLAARIQRLLKQGYQSHLVFLWLPSADLAVDRVAGRVQLGGHNVPEETIRRRYSRGLKNFFSIYRPLVTRWRVYDNSFADRPKQIASGGVGRSMRIVDRHKWDTICRGFNREGQEA